MAKATARPTSRRKLAAAAPKPVPKPTDVSRLVELIRCHHRSILMVTNEEEYALDVIRDAAMTVQRDINYWSAVRGVFDVNHAYNQGKSDTENAAAGLYMFAHNLPPSSICVAFDLAEHLEDARTLRAWRECIRAFERNGNTLIMLDHSDKLPGIILHEATRFDISLPDDEEIEAIIRRTLRRKHRIQPIEISLSKSNLSTIVRNLRGLTRRQAEQIIVDLVAIDRKLDQDDINKVLARKRQVLQQGELLDYIEAPVDLSEIGGLRHLKAWLRKRQNAFSEKAVEYGLSAPRGVLMLGVQGAGKSLCAKAIATAWQRPLLRLDPGRLFNSYIGESERQLREALQQSEAMSPIILWIDEIEKGFASASSASNDGGLSRRMFGTLLTWMQEHTSPVFMVATANDIEALPPELLRKGRFDEIFFVDLPPPDTRRQILEIHLRRRDRDPTTFNLDRLVEASDGYSGAEIEQGIISALHEAFDQKKNLTTSMVEKSLRDSPPLSVTMRERIDDLRRWAQGRCVPAD